METYEERQKAFEWASSKSLKEIHWLLTVLASDIDAFTGVNRKAILEVAALRLGKELRGDPS